ncbi:hypothetical protein [Edaphobacter modestus]|uniref:DUF3604 domain-containing protein n=1 Tax=Edaphobacter modestus TaxID=388466 RepID=A0A4Q7YYX1_9BACT|nr:hypothetical protein [Edaphobacter modestus]RZU42385.1 hypothetical protein BDD14_3954 [Edaphobacter modestus]
MSRTAASILRTLTVATAVIPAIAATGAYAWAQQTKPASSTTTKSSQYSNATAPEYHIYRGSTHAHTSSTWSHGEQWAKNECKGVPLYGSDRNYPEVHSWAPEGNQPPSGKCPSMIIIGSAQYPGPYNELRPDWKKHQGPPSEHFALAKENGYDFYAVTDHSQDAGFQPPSPANTTWMNTKREAAEATNAEFVAIAGYEHSENDGPNGVGHINVFNSAGYLNALDPGVDLPRLYSWLKTAKPNGAGPIVASFNHPDAKQYNDWAYRDAQITDIITMLEVINSNNKIHEKGFIAALDKGWKVSPVDGNDNHGTTGIARNTSRTFVLATSRTKVAILEAMKHRRTYASLDNNIQCRYSINGAIMGATLARQNTFKFDIQISDPDTNQPKDKITKIEIVKDHGEVVQSYVPDTPDYRVSWSPTITDSTSTYFYIRVWNAGGGDAPGGSPDKPIAWLAPVWTGR